MVNLTAQKDLYTAISLDWEEDFVTAGVPGILQNSV